MKKSFILFLLLLLNSVFSVGCSDANKLHDDFEKVENINVISDADQGGELISVKKKDLTSEVISLIGVRMENLVKSGVEATFYCNLEANMVNEINLDNAPVLVCYDPVYNLTYYVNYGRDYFVYAYRDGKKEKAVEIPAGDLFCKDGELYFIAKDYNLYEFSGFTDGNILKYDPADGSVSVFSECKADRMTVYSDGVCYSEILTIQMDEQLGRVPGAKKYTFISFSTGKEENLPLANDALRRWNGAWLIHYYGGGEVPISVSESDPLYQEVAALGYTLAAPIDTPTIEKIEMIDLTGKVTGSLKNVSGIPDNYWIKEDYIYYIDCRDDGDETRYYFVRYDMNTGEHEELIELGYSVSATTSDMLLLKDELYFTNGLKVNLATKEQFYILREQDSTNSELTYSSINHFYTDGIYIFCLSDGKMWVFNEKNGPYSIEKESISGVTLLFGNRVYELIEP